MRLKTSLGTGLFSWNRHERVSDRYGAVTLLDGNDKAIQAVPANLIGHKGKLIAEVRETRQSQHIGDFFRGLSPETPEIGESITLGTGTLFEEPAEGQANRAVGLKPEKRRESDWLNPKAMYRCHDQTVELFFLSTD